MTETGAGIARMAVAIVAIAVSAGTALADTAITRRVEDHLHQALDDSLAPTDYHHLVMMMSWRDTIADWRWVPSAC